MPAEKPKADPFVYTLLAGAALCAIYLLYLAGDGVRNLWLAHQYPANSICARQSENRAHADIVLFNVGITKPGDTPEEKRKFQEETGMQVAEAQRAGAEQFFAVMETAERAKATGVARPGTLCLPENLVEQREAVFAAYSKDLAGRLKAHPETCNHDADADAMAWIVARFPCSQSAPAKPPAGHP